MTELNPLAAALQTGTQSGAADAAQTGLADNFDTFLTLLTEQLQNQDPLEPMNSQEFVQQLVQFSSVEQQIASNQSLEALLELQAATARMSGADYVGKTVTVSAPEQALGEDGAQWSYTLPREAQRTDLVVTDSRGVVVNTLPGETGAGEHAFAWDGRDAAGNALPPGVYSLEVVSSDANDDLLETAVRTDGRVTGVDYAGDAVTLRLANGLTAPLERVIGVREEPRPDA